MARFSLRHALQRCLFEWVLYRDRTAVDDQRRVEAINVLDGGQAPVLDFQDEHAPLGVENDKIGMESCRADGDVVPAEVVILQFRFQQPGKAALTGRIEFASGYAWDEGGHLFCLLRDKKKIGFSELVWVCAVAALRETGSSDAQKKPRIPFNKRKRGSYHEIFPTRTSATPLSPLGDGSFATQGYPCCAFSVTICEQPIKLVTF